MSVSLRNQFCEQRVDEHLQGCIGDLRRLWSAYRAGKEDDGESLAEYGLCFDYVAAGAVVQTFGINAMKRSGALHGSCGENCIPDFGRRFVFDAKLSEFELTFSDPVH